ncbi:hypothetical protein AO946_26500 [Pseudomonas aeruginosa]|jgi:hypothetical protein|uniref:CopG family transcriptional regulator n=1 Tax=Pseudomonas nitroreducens TaxID=46680 RepID=A0ABS0KUG5_PSENT|nr:MULTISPECIES: hypothetical protein [Pseudomonas]EKU4839439.1 hypothetical protein [Pseudomonas aeruginosa]EKW0098639.1 hypothetical protein [Pseudomonas aeruginosa]EKW6686081.1 hypothetical protein [Pseudomonas aeruginosa]EKX6190069.1 hypothetical protein [Pseudomonas aeruginosa]EMA4529683.1 hypothetical protein [Pseudomonas aeruginosa]
MSRSTPTNITLPGQVLEETDQKLVEPLQSERFFGRPSRSMVIRALLEIALENSDRFDPRKARDYETLKAELRRILLDRTGT